MGLPFLDAEPWRVVVVSPTGRYARNQVAGMIEAGKQFRRVNGHLHLRALRDTLNKVTEPVGATGHDETVNAA